MTPTPPPAEFIDRPLRTEEIPPEIRSLLIAWCGRVLARLVVEQQAKTATAQAATGAVPEQTAD